MFLKFSMNIVLIYCRQSLHFLYVLHHSRFIPICVFSSFARLEGAKNAGLTVSELRGLTEILSEATPDPSQSIGRCLCLFLCGAAREALMMWDSIIRDNDIKKAANESKIDSLLLPGAFSPLKLGPKPSFPPIQFVAPSSKETLVSNPQCRDILRIVLHETPITCTV
jgi:hypothetical protein